MTKHNLYYYPYATMTDAELPLLKASALYFDKLYILDPEAASWGTVGADAAAGEAMIRLAAEGVFERLRPEEAIESHGDRLLEAVREDCRDPEFLKLCQDSGKKSSWTLALAKVPLQLRQEEVMRELLGGLPRALVGDLMHGGAPHYAIPNIKKKLAVCGKVRDGWLRRKQKALLGTAGLLAGAATAVINLSVAPFVPVVVVLALLGAAEKGKDVKEVVDDWRAAKDPGNGLSYLVSFS